MTVYQIDYDLNEPDQDYDELFNAIKSLGDYVHLLESVWMVDVSGMEVGDVQDELTPHIDSNDKLLVTKLPEASGGRWATTRIDTEWLEDHLQAD